MEKLNQLIGRLVYGFIAAMVVLAILTYGHMQIMSTKEALQIALAAFLVGCCIIIITILIAYLRLPKKS